MTGLLFNLNPSKSDNSYCDVNIYFVALNRNMAFVVKIAPSRTYNQQVLRHGKVACKVSSKQKPITDLYLIVWRKAIELIKTFQPNAIKLRNAVH